VGEAFVAAQQQGNNQPRDSTVGIAKWVNGLELIVHERCSN
jgi:hypothetical protein